MFCEQDEWGYDFRRDMEVAHDAYGEEGLDLRWGETGLTLEEGGVGEGGGKREVWPALQSEEEGEICFAVFTVMGWVIFSHF